MSLEEGVQKMAITKVAAPAKLAPGKKGQPTTAVVNSFKATVSANLSYFLYAVHMNAVFVPRDGGEPKLKEITKQTRDDFMEISRKKLSMAIFHTLVHLNKLKKPVIYDRAMLLISLNKIEKAVKAPLEIKLTAKDAPDLFAIDEVAEASYVHVKIEKAADTYQVTSNDLNSKDILKEEAFLAVMNLATSQTIFQDTESFAVYGNGTAYLNDPDGKSFTESLRKIRDTFPTNEKEPAIGLSKGIRVIEGQQGQGAQLALSVDVRKTTFHTDYQPLDQKMAALGIRSTRDVNPHSVSLLKGIRCLVQYPGVTQTKKAPRTIVIDTLSQGSVGQCTFEKDGKKIRMTDYVKNAYKYQIRNTDLPVVVCKQGNGYSPECLVVAPNLRVKTENAQKGLVDALIKGAACAPAVRKEETLKLSKLLKVGAGDEGQAARGITVDPNMMTVPGRVLPSPAIVFGGNKTTSVMNGSFKFDKFTKGAECPNWSLILLGNPGRCNLQVFERALLERAASLGMKLGKPYTESCQMSNIAAQTDAIVKAAKDRGSKFIMMIADKNSVKNHHHLKAAETKYGITTQQVTTFVAGDAPNKTVTMSQLLYKTNEKLTGQNIFATSADLPQWLTLDKTMIIGLTVTHPKSMSADDVKNKVAPSRPATIAWSLNAVSNASKEAAKEAFHFAGAYRYGNPKETVLEDTYESAFLDMADRAIKQYKANRGVIPGIIIVIRGGVAEGDYDKIRDEEVPMWEKAFARLSDKYKPNLVIITANTQHSDRFYRSDFKGRVKPGEQNLSAGTCFDTTITHPKRSEAYIQSHVPFQGTARGVTYTLQYARSMTVGAKALTMEDIEIAMFALTHVHGICSSTTAVPTPLKIANECAKRGVEQFNHYQQSHREWTLKDLESITVQSDSELNGKRFNA